jgi:RND family efflux transporter MFP subunit
MKPKKVSSIRLGSFLPLIFLFLALFILGMCTQAKKEDVEKEKKSAGKEKIPPINVVTLEMKPENLSDSLSLPGTLAPYVSLEVSSEVAGRITAKRVDVGDKVKKGAVLVEIDAEKYRNAYQSAKATYDNAVTTRKRIESLYRSELANKSDLDAVKTEMENARAAMEIASVDLSRTMVTAPDSGMVNRVFVEKGQFMDTGKPVVEIIRIDPVKVVVGIPESDISEVSSIREFEVSVDALKGKKFRAVRHSLSRTTSSLARTYDLELTIDNPSGELLPDMFVRVTIVKKRVAGSFAVPLYAILTIKGKNCVFVAEKNPDHEILEAAFRILGLNMEAPQDTAVLKEVETGIQDGWMVEVKRGLAEGDDVITVGQRSVSNGQRIHIIRTQDEQESLLR